MVSGSAYILFAKALAHSRDFEKVTQCLQLMNRRINLVEVLQVAADALLVIAELHAAKGNVVEIDINARHIKGALRGNVFGLFGKFF